MPLPAGQAKFLARVGSAVQAQRRRSGLTQQRLAELAELDIRTVQRIEAGELDILLSTVLRVKEALKCGWNDLFTG